MRMEFSKSSVISLRTCTRTVFPTIQSVVHVSATNTRSRDNRNLDCRRSLTIAFALDQADCSGAPQCCLRHELIPRTVDCLKMDWCVGIVLHLQAEFPNVIVYGSGRRVILITPHFI